MKPSCRKIKEMIVDELKGSREYRKYGFPKLAKDESRHKIFLAKIERRKCK
jgi:hypothetical protein